MSKKNKSQKKEAFEVKIGFDQRDENEGSISLSDFEIEGKAPQPNSFFSESDKAKEEASGSNNEEQQEIQESGDLNHAFFEENSESVTEKEVSEIFKREDSNFSLPSNNIEKKESSSAVLASNESAEIIISKPTTENLITKGIVPNTQEPSHTNDKGSFICCKCKLCIVI